MKYKIIVEISPKIMRDYKDTLKELLTKELPDIKGVEIIDKYNEVQWNQDCGVKTLQVKNVINKLN